MNKMSIILVGLLYTIVLQSMDQDQNKQFLDALQNDNNFVSTLQNSCIKNVYDNNTINASNIDTVFPLSLAKEIVKIKLFKSGIITALDTKKRIIHIGSDSTKVHMFFRNNEWYIISISEENKLRIYNFEGKKIIKYKLHEESQVCFLCTMCIDNTYYAITGHEDNTIKIFDIFKQNDNRKIKEYQGHTDMVNSVSAKCIDNVWYIVSASKDGTVQVWDFYKDTLFTSYTGHSNGVNWACAEYMYGTWYIISGSNDETVHVWNFYTGSLTAQYKGHTDGVVSLCTAYMDNTWYIISSSNDSTVRVWNFHTGALTSKYKGHTQEYNSVYLVYVGDSWYIISSLNGTIQLFDFARNTILLEYEDDNKWSDLVDIIHKDGTWHIVSATYFTVNTCDILTLVDKLGNIGYEECKKVLFILEKNSSYKEKYQQIKNVLYANNITDNVVATHNKKRKHEKLN